MKKQAQDRSLSDKIYQTFNLKGKLTNKLDPEQKLLFDFILKVDKKSRDILIGLNSSSSVTKNLKDAFSLYEKDDYLTCGLKIATINKILLSVGETHKQIQKEFNGVNIKEFSKKRFLDSGGDEESLREISSSFENKNITKTAGIFDWFSSSNLYNLVNKDRWKNLFKTSNPIIASTKKILDEINVLLKSIISKFDELSSDLKKYDIFSYKNHSAELIKIIDSCDFIIKKYISQSFEPFAKQVFPTQVSNELEAAIDQDKPELVKDKIKDQEAKRANVLNSTENTTNVSVTEDKDSFAPNVAEEESSGLSLEEDLTSALQSLLVQPTANKEETKDDKKKEETKDDKKKEENKKRREEKKKEEISVQPARAEQTIVEKVEPEESFVFPDVINTGNPEIDKMFNPEPTEEKKEKVEEDVDPLDQFFPMSFGIKMPKSDSSSDEDMNEEEYSSQISLAYETLLSAKNKKVPSSKNVDKYSEFVEQVDDTLSKAYFIYKALLEHPVPFVLDKKCEEKKNMLKASLTMFKSLFSSITSKHGNIPICIDDLTKKLNEKIHEIRMYSEASSLSAIMQKTASYDDLIKLTNKLIDNHEYKKASIVIQKVLPKLSKKDFRYITCLTLMIDLGK